MITIIESGPNVWAVAATNGDLHIYSREQAGEWSEVSLSEDSEQIDQDGSLILEALYGQQAGPTPDEEEEEPVAEGEDEEEEPEAEEEEEEEEPDEEEPEDDQEPDEEEETADDEEQKPRRRRAKTTASRGRSKAKAK